MPEQVPGSAASSIDTGQLLDHILNANKSDLSDLARKAMTPIAGGHATQIPLSMQQPQKEIGPGPMIPHEPGRDVVGAGNARGVGIGNAVLGVTHALAATTTALDNKKKVEVASATQQLLVAQQSMDQAQQALKNNPNDPEAKAAVDRNKAVMDGILSNDKLRKAISKGMNIDFTDPSANDSLEHAGVAQGKTMAKQHMSYADQFNQKTPTVMQPNQQAQAQYAAAIEQQKINTDAVKAIIPLISAQMRAASADARTKGILDAEKFKSMTQVAMQQAKDTAAWNRTLAQIQGRKDVAKDQFGYKMQEIAAQGDNALRVAQEKITAKATDPMAQLKAYEDFQAKSTGVIAKMTSNIRDLEKEKSLNVDKTGSTAKDLNDQITTAQNALKSYQASVKSTNDWYNQYAGMSGQNGTGSNSTRKLGDANTYLNSLTDDEVEADSDDNDE